MFDICVSAGVQRGKAGDFLRRAPGAAGDVPAAAAGRVPAAVTVAALVTPAAGPNSTTAAPPTITARIRLCIAIPHFPGTCG